MGCGWPTVVGVWEKVGEVLDGMRAASAGTDGADERHHELGEVLFAMVNLARWMGFDPEESRRSANRRWMERYVAVEALAAERGLVLADLDAAAQDVHWNAVKAR